MGLASANTSNEGMQLCVFDLRRGQLEGQELDKILFFFPADLPFSTQLSVIGLSEGLITFTRSVPILEPNYSIANFSLFFPPKFVVMYRLNIELYAEFSLQKHLVRS